MKLLFKTITSQRAREIAKARSARYGVTFDFYHIGDGYIVAPIVDTREQDETLALRLLPFVPRPMSQGGVVAMSISSGLTLRETVIAMRTLAQTQRAVADVNRNGNFAAIRLPQR